MIPFADSAYFDYDYENILYLDRRLWSFRCNLKDYTDDNTHKTPFKAFFNLLEKIAEKIIYLEDHFEYAECGILYGFNDKRKIVALDKYIFRGYELDWEDLSERDREKYLTEDDVENIDSKYRKGPFIDYYMKHNITKSREEEWGKY